MTDENKNPDNDESNLVTHARRELEIIGEDPETIKGYLKVVQAFANMGHSGGSAMVAIPTLNALFRYQNLKPLTDNPDEWQYIAEDQWGREGGIWQNIRRSEAFSNDAGKTYYLLSEGGNNNNRLPMHESEKHLG